MGNMLKWGGHLFIVLTLSILTFTGGLAWLLALAGRRFTHLIRFGLWYAFFACLLLALTSGQSRFATQSASRVSATFLSGPALKSPLLYRLSNRDFVSPNLRGVAIDLAAHMQASFPVLTQTTTYTLDGNFPFVDGLPLLPHLSHDDGEKLDLALYWLDREGHYIQSAGKSPIGYWGYVAGRSSCAPKLLDLRWDMNWLQSLLPNYQLDKKRTRAALVWLSRDPRVKKILVEPHILTAINYRHPKIRFQGCNAARHDDHIHIQL